MYYQRAVSFSFIDEFNNFSSGYFLLQGRQLYSEIFLQHNMLMPYLSAGIQFLFRPDSMYKLVLDHRLFVALFAFFWDIFFIIKYRWYGFAFVAVFEISKYYSFGNLFLGESLVVYPILYLFILGITLLEKQKIAQYDMLLSGVAVWFIVWTREPLIPVALFLYAAVLLLVKKKKERLITLGIFVFLSIIILLMTNIPAYLYQILYVNFHTVFLSETKSEGTQGIGLLRIFLYPIEIFLTGTWNVFRLFSIALSGFSLLSLFFVIFFLKKIKIAAFVFVTLGLAAVRMTMPGTTFYVAYHMIVWYGLCIFSTIFLFSLLHQHKQTKLVSNILFTAFVFTNIYVFLVHKSFLYDTVNRQNDFTVAYARYYDYGEAVHQLSTKNNTLFVDNYDSIIYWQAKLPSAYQYSFFYPTMQTFPLFLKARETMFDSHPPTFVYENCTDASIGIPNDKQILYTRLNGVNGPSCLYIYKNDIKNITKNQWQTAKSLGFSLPDKT